MENEICIWGDSIAKGVIYDEARGRYAILKENCMRLIAEGLGRPLINHAKMGQTVGEALTAMRDEDMLDGDVAVIEFGGNDCDMPWKDIAERPDEDHLPKATLAAFRESMSAMIARVKAANMRPLLVTPPPLDAKRYFNWISKNLDASAILKWLGDVDHIYRWQERYAAAVRDVAAATQTRLFDLRDAFLSQRVVSELLCLDGIHPNARGHKLIAEAALAALS